MPGDAVVIDRDGLDQLLAALDRRGYRILGPVERDRAIALDEVKSVEDLPQGWHDTQAPGTYRLEQSGDGSLFGWAVGQQSLKADVFPSRRVMWRAQVTGGTVRFEQTAERWRPTAVVGIRPCENAALGVLDRVLGRGPVHDDLFESRRADFVVVAECTAPSGSCFCTSMGTGPSARDGFDLSLVELMDRDDQRFVVRVGTDRGAEVLGEVPSRPASTYDSDLRERELAEAAGKMGRHLDTDGLAQLLARNLDHPRWDEVADRCLACGNCTLVCPTCFCATFGDTSDLGGAAGRERSWASCFDLAHSYLHGGPVRESLASRYRQWMTHKLSTWWDQFGTSGCVGCGRCITWCPVGIDITEECAAIRVTDGARGRGAGRGPGRPTTGNDSR